MDVVVTKIISLLILTILSVLCGLLPLRLLLHMPHLFTRSRNSVDCFLCGLRLFSGGIYMATCFLHLMPDTREKMAAVMLNMGSKTTYAVPELLIMTGFYAVVFVEQIIQVLYVKAQESDANRRLKKARKAKAKADAANKQTVQVFRSTLDEDVSPNGNHMGGKTFSGDEEDDDYDDNVLIDDEEDMSFHDTESDRKSVDSATEVKESLLENGPTSNMPLVNRNNNHIQVIPNHVHTINIKSIRTPQPMIGNSQPFSYTEVGTHLLRTFSRVSLENVPTSLASDVKPLQDPTPPMIHTHVQHLPLHSMKDKCQHQHINQNHRPHHQSNQLLQQEILKSQQETVPKSRTSSSPPPILPRKPFTLEQQQQLHKPVPPIPTHEPTFARKGNQYPVITHSPDIEQENILEHGRDDHNWSVPVGVEMGSSNVRDSATKQSGDSAHDRDVDSGVFSTRRECENSESDTRKFTISRDVSFDKISDSSSALQDLEVKRVVDELSRTDASHAYFRSIIYIMALSFHGIFEGMALGLQSVKSSVWALCFAIVVHRCVLAFKLGMDLCRGEEKQGMTFLCIGTFTLISTLGIITGILISSGASFYSDITVPEAILQSLATGTIFYIVFFDIFFKDMEGKDDLKRVSCSFVGFSLMAIVFAITRS
ncbi:hypothetical protein BsWGS_05364 [Bradybaena similaris]